MGQFNFCFNRCAPSPNSRLSLFAFYSLASSCDNLAHPLDIVDAEPDLWKLRVIVGFVQGVCLSEQ